jgi:hypothetical protein
VDESATFSKSKSERRNSVVSLLRHCRLTLPMRMLLDEIFRLGGLYGARPPAPNSAATLAKTFQLLDFTTYLSLRIFRAVS